MPEYVDSISQAAKTIMQDLCAATGCQEGASAFQYVLPAKLNVWRLSISGGNNTNLQGCAVSSLLMRATIEGRFSDVEKAHRFAMQAASIVPIRNKGNIECFSFLEVPAFESEKVLLGQQERECIAYKCTIVCDLALTCG